MREDKEFESREYDKKLNLLIQQFGVMHDTMVRVEIEQKQLGTAFSKIDKYLFGNGKPGLAEEHIICKDKLSRYDKITDKLVGIIITIVLQFILTGSGLAFLYFKK